MTKPVANNNKSVAFEVNGKFVSFDDTKVEGRDILNEAGFAPASEHQLILVKKGRTRLLGLDDTVDLKREAGGTFRAFQSDRIFAFTVDEVAQVWGEAEMTVDEFLTHWPAPDAREWLLERDSQPDIVLVSGGVLDFDPDGVEDIVSRKAEPDARISVTVFTTSGTFPPQGAYRVDRDSGIATLLERAARKLNLTATDGWVLQHNGQDVNAALTFGQAGLSGKVDLEWGPREGGGGNA